MLSNASVCFAHDKSVKNKRKDVAGWCQGNLDNQFKDTAKIVLDGEHTVENSGCGLMALSYARVKAGEISKTKDVPFKDTIDKAISKNAFYDEGAGKGWLIDYEKSDLICSDLTVATGDDAGLEKFKGKKLGQIKTTFSTPETILSDINNLYNKGLYVIAIVSRKDMTSAHAIFIDQPIDDGKDFIIGDSGVPGYGNINNGSVLKLSDAYTPDGIIALSVLKSKSGKQANKQKSIYSDSEVADKLKLSKNGKDNKLDAGEYKDENMPGSVGGAGNKKGDFNKSGSGDGSSDTAVDLSGPMHSEWELVGMEDVNKWIKDGGFSFDLPTDIDEKYRDNVELIKDSIDNRKYTVLGIVNIIIKVLGIILLAYTSLFIAFYIFDLVNTVITFSLLSILTLGRYRVYRKDEVDRRDELSNVKSVVYLSIPGMILRCLCLFLISWLIISGRIFDVGQFIINWVSNLVG